MAFGKKEQQKYFESQDPNEKIELVIRKHKLVLAMPFIFAGVIIFFIFVLYFLALFINGLESEVVRALVWTAISLTIPFVILFSFMVWLIKYLDILILTNKRLVVIRQDGLFRRGVSVLDLGTIQDVSAKQHGVLQTFFGFGKVNVQTAGEAPNFVYSGAAEPAKIQDKIIEAKQAVLKDKGSGRELAG